MPEETDKKEERDFLKLDRSRIQRKRGELVDLLEKLTIKQQQVHGQLELLDELMEWKENE